jgi:excisionase family DNA binding protein
MGQQMMAAMSTAPTTPSGGPAGTGIPPVIPNATGIPELLGTADLARILGVSESDVLATLEKGELKGKKIGSTWRVTREALDEFLKS